MMFMGSSSPNTKQQFLDEAYYLGKRIAELGHVCINGAGLHGCMGAVNKGCFSANGEVIGEKYSFYMIENKPYFFRNLSRTFQRWRPSNFKQNSLYWRRPC